jgi:hypothetical protein
VGVGFGNVLSLTRKGIGGWRKNGQLTQKHSERRKKEKLVTGET